MIFALNISSNRVDIERRHSPAAAPVSANMTITMRTKTRLVERDNLVFYNVTAVKVDYDLTGLRLRFDNLFEGVQALGKCNRLLSYT